MSDWADKGSNTAYAYHMPGPVLRNTQFDNCVWGKWGTERLKWLAQGSSEIEELEFKPIGLFLEPMVLTTLSLTSCAILRKLLNFSQPYFCYLYNGDNGSDPMRPFEALNETAKNSASGQSCWEAIHKWRCATRQSCLAQCLLWWKCFKFYHYYSISIVWQYQ